MDEFYSDNFFDGNAPIGWSERDWFDYLKKSEREISKFASVYSVNRLRGKSLEEIATIAGWPIPKFDDEYFEESDAEFSDDPAKPPRIYNNAWIDALLAGTSWPRDS